MNSIGKFWFSYFVLLFGGINFSVNAQSVKEISLLNLQEIFASKESKVNVINFWATWCKPCVEELPGFETLSKIYSFKEVGVTLVSMDFISQIDRVNQFVSKYNLVSNVVLLNEPDYNSWINKVEPSWSGALPATLIINMESGERKFFEKSMKPEELQNEINAFLNK
jgi:thiol-disulfide isomerase/thioredoxin